MRKKVSDVSELLILKSMNPLSAMRRHENAAWKSYLFENCRLFELSEKIVSWNSTVMLLKYRQEIF